MPIDYRRYPENWKETSRQIRDRAGNRCELCGAPNHVYICRDITGLYWREVMPEEARRLRDEA